MNVKGSLTSLHLWYPLPSWMV